MPSDVWGIAEKILDCPQSHGISEEDVIIDPLAVAVATDNMAARVTLEAIKLIRMNLGVSTTLGSSSISFGLPERSLVNRVFLAMAMAAGLSSAIVGPVDIEIRKTIAAGDLLLSRDEFAQRLLQRFQTGW
jgi:5-methyltetrahydrofolate--homocysteine methyltransferase